MRWLARLLTIAGALLLLFVAGVSIYSRAFEDRELARFADRPAPTAPRVPAEARRARAAAQRDGVIGRLTIPRLGVSVIVVEGTGSLALTRGVGHVARTAFPGENGNVGLAAHRDTYFRPLARIATGDTVTLVTADGAFAYAVDTTMIVRPSRGDLLDDTGRPVVTLVTCYPFHWIGPAPRRFVVRARRIDAAPGRAAQPGTARSPTAVARLAAR